MKNRATTAVAVLALTIAVGGTAAAANHYVITSARQIKPSAIRAIVGHTPVAPLEYLEGPVSIIPPGEVGAAKADCPSYSHAVSAAGDGGIAGIADLGIGQTGAFVIVANQTPIPVEIKAEVVCAPVGGAIVSSHGRGLAQREAAALARIRRLR